MNLRVWTTALLLASTLSGCSADADPKDTGATAGVDADLGMKTYQTNCQVCHGIDGEGGAGSTLNDGRLAGSSSGDIEAIVRDGTDDMPSFGSRLSGDEISAVAEYVLTTFGGS